MNLEIEGERHCEIFRFVSSQCVSSELVGGMV